MNSNSTEKVLVTGGASFIGSCLVDKLMSRGDNVQISGNFTGTRENVGQWLNNVNFPIARAKQTQIARLETKLYNS